MMLTLTSIPHFYKQNDETMCDTERRLAYSCETMYSTVHRLQKEFWYPIHAVVKSEILDSEPTKIHVTFSVDMKGTRKLKDAISVLGGGTVVPLASANVHTNSMTTTVQNAFVNGDVVTWAYNDRHHTERLESIDGIKMDNQTYTVVNNVPAATTGP